MRGSDFEFDGVKFLYYDFNKTSIIRGGSYIDSPKWLKDKKSTINPKNNDNKCFQYAVTLALNLDRIKKNHQRISKIKPFIEKYNWKNIDFPSTSKDWNAAHNICNLRYKVPKEIPIVLHNGSTYDYHFIIKELVKEFNGNFECLGENTEKYITFSVPIKKKIKNKDLEITYKIKFTDSYKFMSSSLSKLVDNLSEGIHNNKC